MRPRHLYTQHWERKQLVERQFRTDDDRPSTGYVREAPYMPRAKRGWLASLFFGPPAPRWRHPFDDEGRDALKLEFAHDARTVRGVVGPLDPRRSAKLPLIRDLWVDGSAPWRVADGVDFVLTPERGAAGGGLVRSGAALDRATTEIASEPEWFGEDCVASCRRASAIVSAPARPARSSATKTGHGWSSELWSGSPSARWGERVGSAELKRVRRETPRGPGRPRWVGGGGRGCGHSGSRSASGRGSRFVASR